MRSHRRSRALAVTVVATVVISLIHSIPVAGLSASACRVRNVDTGVTKRTFASAVAAAASGHRLTVRGVCAAVTTVDRDLTITGIRPKGAARPTLKGSGFGSALTIPAGRTVRIVKLTVTGGTGTNSFGETSGGGLHVGGAVTLESVIVRENTATYGAGVYVAPSAELTLRGRSSIVQNTAQKLGGGVLTEGTFSMHNASTVRTNTATSQNGGGVHVLAGTATLEDTASIAGNSAPLGDGGGVFNQGSLVLEGSASIRDNTADASGGVANGGSIVLNDSASIRGNTATSGNGGGVGSAGSGGQTLTLNDSASIRGNVADPDGSSWGGGGVQLVGQLTLNGTATIRENSAPQGGGIYVSSGSAAIAGTAAVTANTATTPLGGGGLYLFYGGTVTSGACGTTISGNTPTDCAAP